jgi:hypothetical protein
MCRDSSLSFRPNGMLMYRATGINNGILLIRNSDWSRRFWGEVTSHATTEVCRTAPPDTVTSRQKLWAAHVHAKEHSCLSPICLRHVHLGSLRSPRIKQAKQDAVVLAGFSSVAA